MFNTFNSGGDNCTSSTNDAFVSNDAFNNMSETNQTNNQRAHDVSQHQLNLLLNP